MYGSVYTPFTAVVDLETMIVIDCNVGTTDLMSTTDIMTAVNLANSN